MSKINFGGRQLGRAQKSRRKQAIGREHASGWGGGGKQGVHNKDPYLDTIPTPSTQEGRDRNTEQDLVLISGPATKEIFKTHPLRPAMLESAKSARAVHLGIKLLVLLTANLMLHSSTK